MAQRYENIMVAVDGSKEADLAFIKGVHSALRNQAKLTMLMSLTHVLFKASQHLMPKFTKNCK